MEQTGLETGLPTLKDGRGTEVEGKEDNINKNQTQRTNMKSSKGKTTNNTQGNCHKDNS